MMSDDQKMVEGIKLRVDKAVTAAIRKAIK